MKSSNWSILTFRENLTPAIWTDGMVLILFLDGSERDVTDRKGITLTSSKTIGIC
jgi:hypothetical protein